MLTIVTITLPTLACAMHIAALGSSPQAPLSMATLRGVVVDARTAAPLESVLVQLEDPHRSVITDKGGRFDLGQVEPGRRSLLISLVGYALAKQDLVLLAGQTTELSISLAEGTSTHRETVTVTGEAQPIDQRLVPSEQWLGSQDLQNLRGMLTDDPFRAVQTLPGVVATDDFRSEFSVRGSDFRHIGVVLDGVLTPLLLHSVPGLPDTGSIAMINSDLLENVVFFGGAYPQRFGQRTGALVEFSTREGSRDRYQTRVALSGTSASGVSEGPIAKGRGSWLASVRKSYLDLLIKQLEPETTVSFGFTDGFVKLVYDGSSRHQLQLSFVGGRSRFDEEAESGVNEVRTANTTTGLLNASWQFIPSPTLMLRQRVALVISDFRGEDLSGVQVDGGIRRDATYRATANYAPSPRYALELGGHLQRSTETRRQETFDVRRRVLLVVDEYDASEIGTSAYAQARWNPSERLWINGGGRVDRTDLTDEMTASPWLEAEWRMARGLRARVGTGLFRQVPRFDQVVGSRGNANLEAERAQHYELSLEHQFSPATRWQITWYDREDRGFLRLPDAETRVVNDVVRLGSRVTHYQNALDGYARGVELLLQRRAPSGLTGWIAYAFGRSRYTDRLTGERFWGDFDQRHTLNVYAHYRIATRTSVAAKFRAGSNVPISAYVEQRDGKYFLSDRRNLTRLPPYSRLDLRVNRTFNYKRSRLTLFGELLNVLNHGNSRPVQGGLNTTTRQVFGLVDPSFPIVPSAGILIEF